MKRLALHLCIAALLLLPMVSGPLRAATSATPDFHEVYDVIRTNATGLSEADLNRAAVEGLLNALGPRASLVSNDAANPAGNLPSLSKATVFDGEIAYLRLSRIDENVAKAVGDTFEQMNSTNHLKGLVLDVRYTDGTDYDATAAVADLFVTKAEPLLTAANGTVSSHAKTNAVSLPLAVLVNRSTSGAAEALAAVLRQTGAGLIIGSRTAGQAFLTRDFPLKNGSQLRIGAKPVTLGDGSALPSQGIKPDIDVTVGAEDERAYYADSFRIVPKTNPLAGASTNAAATNAPRRSRINEAELVREHREGANTDSETPTRPPETLPPLISDPALARAIDLLKGLAVVRQNR